MKLSVVLVLLVGCTAGSAAKGMINASYALKLDECRAQGKAANSMDIYTMCADKVDADLCKEKGLRCKP